jgi:hypothetical protein
MTDYKQWVDAYYERLEPESQEAGSQTIDIIVEQKEKGKKVMVITGSGPNLHEGVTTLISELMHKGIVDGVSTSSATIAHELAGTLDRVHRVHGPDLGFDSSELPRGEIFEITALSDEAISELEKEMPLDKDLIARGMALEGKDIIKAAGNMAYPMGLRTERLARDILAMAKTFGLPFEQVAGWGADDRTMLGAGAALGMPVLVSVPQLIGGGGVGLAIGDSVSITERCSRIAEMVDDAAILIESAIALTQEIHDGPFETFTGHGIWADWDGSPTTRLEGKTLIRIDMDPQLKKAWDMQRSDSTIQMAIDKGLPKTKLTGIPFRMEMSGFARLDTSLPVIGDIGVVWPLIACQVAEKLGIELDYISHPQDTKEGQAFRDWIVEDIKPFSKAKMVKRSKDWSKA